MPANFYQNKNMSINPEKFESRFQTKQETERIELQEVLVKIAKLFRNLPSEKEVLEAEEKQDKILREFVEGNSLENFNKQPDIEQPGKVDFSNLNILSEVMHKLEFDEDLIEKTIAHEGAHAKEIERLGLVPKFSMRFFNTEKNRRRCIPATSFDLPEQGNEEELRKALKIILEAPLDLSDRDQKQLKMYEKKL